MSNKVVLILGAGKNIGLASIQQFAAAGWKVAAVSRTVSDDVKAAAHHTISADLSDPSSIPGIFQQVTASIGAPSAVVYNAFATHESSAEDPLSVSPEDFSHDVHVNFLTLYAAAHYATKIFATLPPSAPKTFISTGNAMNRKNYIFLPGLGAGKVGAAYIIEAASKGYRQTRGWRFYFVDERMADRRPAAFGIDGQAHAEIFEKLAGESVEEGKKRDWEVHFVKGGEITNFGTDVGGVDGLSFGKP